MRKYTARDSRERVDTGTKGSYGGMEITMSKCFTLMKEPATENKLDYHKTQILSC
jgi:hypothetical protein